MYVSQIFPGGMEIKASGSTTLPLTTHHFSIHGHRVDV